MNVLTKPRKKEHMEVHAEMNCNRSRNGTAILDEAKSVLIHFRNFYADYFLVSCLKSDIVRLLQQLIKYTENLCFSPRKKENTGFIMCTMLFRS